ncbi:CaiB/BaiF CoA transferase family protein [Chloroflexota bacterium]
MKGIRVIDFSWVWAGPLGARQLGDMGAEVIKVESHRRIDLARRHPTRIKGRPIKNEIDHDSEVLINFENYNRNKLSVTLDLGNEEARQIAKRLVGVADVVVENFPPRVMKKWGLSYDDLCQVNPSIIMISLSAAGQWGALRDIMTYGPSLGGLAGVETLVGYEDNMPLGSHRDATDPMAAVFAGFAVMAALRYKNRTGKGQHIDMSQWEAGATTIGYPLMDWIMNKRNPRLMGDKHPWAAPHGCYRCLGDDKWVSISVTKEEEWNGLCRAAGNPEWAQDERFGDMRSRKLNEKELDSLIEGWTTGLAPYDAMFCLQAQGVPSAATLNTMETPKDPHFISRHLWTTVLPDNKLEVDDAIMENPYWKLSRTPGAPYRPAPTLGRDQNYVLGELLGMHQDEIAELNKKGVLL